MTERKWDTMSRVERRQWIRDNPKAVKPGPYGLSIIKGVDGQRDVAINANGWWWVR